MNKIDEEYKKLVIDIIENGSDKIDRTNTGTRSVFSREIRHNMKSGFPLLTTKKMYWKGIVTELLWFLRGDTNIKWLVDNNCNIWNGDAYKNYFNKTKDLTLETLHVPFQQTHLFGTIGGSVSKGKFRPYTIEEFVNKIKTDDEFANKWGDLGPVYGKQWRNWEGVDQIENLINDLKSNPDSRRLMVNAWNVANIDQMVLPPCHYGFQVYTRELSFDERFELAVDKGNNPLDMDKTITKSNDI